MAFPWKGRCQTTALLWEVAYEREGVAAVGWASRQKKNGKDWTTVALPSARKQTTYVVKVALRGITYTARSGGDFWGYNPASMIVNSEVEACVDSNRLVITRPDVKQYKPTMRIVWAR